MTAAKTKAKPDDEISRIKAALDALLVDAQLDAFAALMRCDRRRVDAWIGEGGLRDAAVGRAILTVG